MSVILIDGFKFIKDSYRKLDKNNHSQPDLSLVLLKEDYYYF